AEMRRLQRQRAEAGLWQARDKTGEVAARRGGRVAEADWVRIQVVVDADHQRSTRELHLLRRRLGRVLGRFLRRRIIFRVLRRLLRVLRRCCTDGVLAGLSAGLLVVRIFRRIGILAGLLGVLRDLLVLVLLVRRFLLGRGEIGQ